MLKLLMFECATTKKSTLGEKSYDYKAYFDQVYSSQSNIYASKQNIDKHLPITRAMCVDRIERHVTTGAGVSSQSYNNKEG